MDYLRKSAEILVGTGFEGNVPFMYRAGDGFVTVGVGEKLPNVNIAKRFHFRTQLDADATVAQIEANFERVLDMPGGLPHERYRNSTSLLLSPDYIQNLLLTKLKECDAALREHYDLYDSFPEPVKLALLDMIYNLGKAQLFGQFPAFEKAVIAQDWKTAALQCHRKHSGATDNRNAWTHHQLLISEVKKPIPRLPVHPAHYDAPALLPRKG
jgi:GH24 family phage-related lysozyme (muramidase)